MNFWAPVGVGIAALLTIAMIGTAGWDLPPVETEQVGYRGTGMVLVKDREELAALEAAVAAIPEQPWEADPTGSRASEVYENVQVLGHLSQDQFDHLMASITEWVSPEEGCGYCHNLENLADDSVYTKIVARRMIQMTWEINSEWTEHVAQTGVNCYTCHRGMPVPENVWYRNDGPPQASGMAGYRAGQNVVAESAGTTSLPYDHLSDYLLGDREIRVHTLTVGPSGNQSTIKDTEWTYALMMHMSESLGANCTFCHNSRAFNDWDESPPQRVTAWHGIRMARAVNNDYLVPLTPIFPDNRLGPQGDVAKVSCATCHYGAKKPLNGTPMLENYPVLRSAETAEGPPEGGSDAAGAASGGEALAETARSE